MRINDLDQCLVARHWSYAKTNFDEPPETCQGSNCLNFSRFLKIANFFFQL